jgi:hypothetical protein
MTMRRFGSIVFAVTGIETSYISQSHWMRLPASSRPLPFVNQNFEVMSGSTIASNTSATGLRTSIPVVATGVCVSCWMAMVFSCCPGSTM